MNFLQDKEAWIKSSWKATVLKGTSKVFTCPSGLFHKHQKCWVGMCLQSPIQWNWFHPATPRSRELLISQVWNRSERSSRRRTSGSREKDWKVELKLADIWCILLLQSISCHGCKYIFVLLIFLQFQLLCSPDSFYFYSPNIFISASKLLF